MLENGCSAFVISNVAAMTSAHCLDVTEMFVKHELKEIMKASIDRVRHLKEQIEFTKMHCYTHAPPYLCDNQIASLNFHIDEELKAREEISEVQKIKIYNTDGKDTGIIATAYSKSGKRRDYGFIKGNFKNFEKLKIKRDHGVKYGDLLKVCGFPNSKVPAICVDYIHAGTKDFMMVGYSMFVPGISGSPAIDHNGEVVGIASSVNGKFSYIDPTLGTVDEDY